MQPSEPFDADVATALLGFNEEAVLYCLTITDADGHEYAMDYARMLRARAKGLDFERSGVSAALSKSAQDLIEDTLGKMYRKYFPTYRVPSALP